MRFRFPNFLASSLVYGVTVINGQSNPNQPLDRPYTLRNPDPLILEAAYHDMAAHGGRMSFLFPRPCLSGSESRRYCGEQHGFSFADTAYNRRINASPAAAYEYRHFGGPVQVLEFGGVLTGNNGPASFYLDARMYTEHQSSSSGRNYDREYVDLQDESSTGSVAYASYSRYRANLSYDFDWGRLSAGRDAAHWGPSVFNNLVFHQSAVPFNQASFTTHIGPLTVFSLFGDLAVEEDRVFSTEPRSRYLYAHRYELSVTENLLLGLSEQLIVSGTSEHFAILPVVPLFVFKSDSWERVNNGNMAVDFCYRIPGLGRAYSEFLIDDIQSPTSLFDDQWGNKWAWMAGLHLIRPVFTRQAGLIAEYARLEPWVYTHYLPSSAQAANLGYPLGNPHGPNSQNALLSFYCLPSARWNRSYTAGLEWKGNDHGSGIEDIPEPSRGRKTFLGGGPGPQGIHRIRGHFQLGKFGMEGRFQAAGEVTASVRLVFRH